MHGKGGAKMNMKHILLIMGGFLVTTIGAAFTKNQFIVIVNGVALMSFGGYAIFYHIPAHEDVFEPIRRRHKNELPRS